MRMKMGSFHRPFSHDLGKSCLIPKSACTLLAYPTRLVLSSLDKKQKTYILSFEMHGPIKNFTLLQDIDRGFVRVFGKSLEGYFSCRLFAEKERIVFLLERCPEKGLSIFYQGKKWCVQRKETLSFPFGSKSFFQEKTSMETLHLGSHKKQDLTFIRRRLSLNEILPLWFALGQSYPRLSYEKEEIALLLEECQKRIQEKKKIEIGPMLLNLFCAGFKDFFIPRITDTDYQGLLPLQLKEKKASALFLLSEGAFLIRTLFLEEKKDKIALLPCLPPSLHAGHLIDAKIVKRHLTLDLEWSKKKLRRLYLHSALDQTLCLELQKEIKTFRLRTDGKQRGAVFSRDAPLFLKANTFYLLDRFEK